MNPANIPDYNRSALINHLEKLLHDNSDKTAAKNIGLIAIELYNLKTLEAQYGHQASLQMNLQSEKLINRILRPSDLLCRLNDKCFAIVLNPVINIEHCSLAMKRLLTLFSECSEIQKRCHRTNIRMGLALAPLHSTQADRLVNYAELALDKANTLKTPYYVYNNKLATALVSQAILEEDLLNSIKQDELKIVYQPQYSLTNGRMTGAEALLRWNNNKHGDISPEQFIPIAENAHFIEALSEWVFNTVLRQCRPIIEKDSNFTISVNASVPLLDNDFFVNFIERATTLWGYARNQLIIEITESIMMRRPEKVVDTLNRLRALGIKLAIDDFGTGFSSFYYLQKLPIQELKIDKSFLIDLTKQNENWKIVQSIVDLAKRFDLETVAEGIETDETLQLMQSLGVDRVQGFLTGKPMSYDRLYSNLNNNLITSKLLDSNQQ